MRPLPPIVAFIVLAACKPAPSTSEPVPPAPAATPATAAPTTSAPTASTPAPGPAGDPTAQVPAFAGKVWRAQASTGVEAGTTYAFLADGTLVIDSPNGTPMHGHWSYDNDRLVMVEEGISYATDILELDSDAFRIRSNNPGGSVEIALVPAPDVPLPTAATK
jgi:hypothetical protein